MSQIGVVVPGRVPSPGRVVGAVKTGRLSRSVHVESVTSWVSTVLPDTFQENSPDDLVKNAPPSTEHNEFAVDFRRDFPLLRDLSGDLVVVALHLSNTVSRVGCHKASDPEIDMKGVCVSGAF